MEKINFILDNLPDLYNKETDSNLYKILNPIAEKLDKFVIDVDKVRDTKFIDKATEKDLDAIAKLLNLKRFNYESDESFRGRIKSRVPSFIGGGTISALKQVVNSYLGVEPIIIEHYKSGDGHAYFDKGVLNGLNIESIDSTNAKVNSGIAYINGARFNLNESINSIAAGDQYFKYNLFVDNYNIVSNFVGKVSNSVIENPNLMRVSIGSTFLSPTTIISDNSEQTQTTYDKIISLNNTSAVTSTSTSQQIAKHLFSFNLIEYFEKKYGSIPATNIGDKVIWLKNNLKQIVCNWCGYGNSPTGNKAYLKSWINGAWAGNSNHTNNIVTKLTDTTNTQIINLIQSDGFVHYLAHTNSSDGVIASTINTDYVELIITMKPSNYITIESDNIIKNSQILLGNVNNTSVTDLRNILNPEEHYITNTASITVQIPYNFTSSNIPLEDVKDILRHTKAAGIALLIKIMESYNDTAIIKDSVYTHFIVGFSGIGGNNFLGGV